MEDVAQIHCAAMFSGERTGAVRGRSLSNKVPSASNFLYNRRIVFLDGAQRVWNTALNLL